MPKKQTVHAILGDGVAPAEVIAEGLRDAVGSDDVVALVWAGKPGAGVEAVYDFVLDEEVQFMVFYADPTSPPKVFREADHGLVQKVRNPVRAALEAVQGSGKVLFLWNEDDDDNQIDAVFEHKDSGTLVLELTNGLAPITDSAEIPEPVEAPQVEDDESEEDDSRFTKGELEIMAAPAVKRYGSRLGCKGVTKSSIIAELFPDDDEEEVAREEEKTVAPVFTPVDSDTPYGRFARSLSHHTPSEAAQESIEALRLSAKAYAAVLFSLAPETRERSLALTHLEDSVMWAVKSIVLESSV